MFALSAAGRGRFAGTAAAIALAWTLGVGAATAPPPPAAGQKPAPGAPRSETGSAPESETGGAPESEAPGAPNTAPVDASVNAEVGAVQSGQAADQVAVNAAALSSEDRRFIEQALRAGLAEIESAKLARRNAVSPNVRRIAQHLEMDHTRTNQRLALIASRNGVVTARDATPESQSVLERLERLSGAEFDQEYVQTQVAAHEKAIALFQQALSGGESAEVKTFAQDTLPKLRQHLAMLEESRRRAPTMPPPAAPGR